MDRSNGIWYGCLSVLAGIFIGSFFSSETIWILLSIGAAVGTGVIALVSSRRRKVLFLFILLLLGSAFHSARAHVKWEGSVPSERVRGIFVVIEAPEEKSFSKQAVVRFRSCEEGGCPSSKVLLETGLGTSLEEGRMYHGSCLLSSVENFSSFDYRRFLAAQGIGARCKEKENIESLSEIDPFHFYIGQTREWVLKTIRSVIPEPEAGLAAGLLLGGNDFLDSGTSDRFQMLGLTHIVAVSGYNINLVAVYLVFFAILIGFYRKQAVLLAGIGVVLFVLLVGAPASAVRAGLLAMLSFLAMQSGRYTGSIRALFLVGAIMLLYNPLLLRYDVGFQLSFLATFAIILSSEWRDRIAERVQYGKFFVEAVLVTGIVSLFVLPISLFNFGQFSPYTILANAIFVPLVPIATVLLILFLILSGTFSFLAPIIGWVAYGFLHVIVSGVEWFSLLPFASFSEISLRLPMLCLWYILLMGGYFFLERKRRKKNMDAYVSETMV